MKRPREKKRVSGTDYDPMNRGRRREHRRQQLGPDPVCVRCGERNPDVLTKMRRSLFEQHHPLGEAHDPEFTVDVCLNCHALYSAAQHDDGVPLTPQSTVLERVVAVMSATGSFLRVTSERLPVWADRVKEVVKGLDREFPGWRKRPWA